MKKKQTWHCWCDNSIGYEHGSPKQD